MTIKINGVELAAYPSEFSITNLDIDAGESTSRTADGILNRDRVAVKRQIDMAFGILKTSEISSILKSIQDVYFDVYYLDPQEGAYITKTFYVGNRTAAVSLSKGSTDYWSGLKFTLIER